MDNITVIMTGEIEIGKTTVCQHLVHLIEKSPFSCSGVLTLKRENDLFVRDIQSPREVLFAHKIREKMDEKNSRYEIRSETISIRDKILQRNQNADILLIDEIGPYELNDTYNPIPEYLLSHNHKVTILVVRKKYLEKIQKKLNFKVQVFEVTLKNRDRLPFDIFQWIQDRLNPIKQ